MNGLIMLIRCKPHLLNFITKIVVILVNWNNRTCAYVQMRSWRNAKKRKKKPKRKDVRRRKSVLRALAPFVQVHFTQPGHMIAKKCAKVIRKRLWNCPLLKSSRKKCRFLTRFNWSQKHFGISTFTVHSSTNNN